MEKIKVPFYARAALITVAGFGLIYGLYIAQPILVPIVYATIFAVLLNPFVNFMVGKKINRTVANFIAVSLVVLVMLGLLLLISTQISTVADTYPGMKVKAEASFGELVDWVSERFNIKLRDINAWIKNSKAVAEGDLGPFLGRLILNIWGTLFIVFLIPVYLFLILHYKLLLLEFVRKLFRRGDHAAVVEVLVGTKGIIQSYLVGLMVETLIIAILNSVGLLIIGIDYAILIGVIGALLNLIPYLGGIVAVFLPMVIAFITKDSLVYPLIVFALYMVIQFIDNNLIVPRIVASKVQLNALVSIIVVFVGGVLWGIPGMFLALPLTAILKVVFDHIEITKPWGFLLGNIVPTQSKLSFTRWKKLPTRLKKP